MEAMEHHVRLVSFNVNGLRPMLKRRRGPLTQVLEDLQAGEMCLELHRNIPCCMPLLACEPLHVCADIVCIQETKLSKNNMEEVKDFAVAEGWSVPHHLCVLCLSTVCCCRSDCTQNFSVASPGTPSSPSARLNQDTLA